MSLLLLQSDPLFPQVQLLLNMDGENDGSTTFTDQSSFARTVTPVGNSQITTGEFKFGTGALELDSTGDYLSIPSDTNLQFDHDDFTLEAFIYIHSADILTINTIMNKRDNSGAQEFSWSVNANSNIRGFTFRDGSAVVNITGASSVPPGVWHHVAFVREGLNHYVFLNGELDGSDTQSNTPTSNTEAFKIGRDGFNTGRDFGGYIDAIRVTKGTGAARYTANFEVPFQQHPLINEKLLQEDGSSGIVLQTSEPGVTLRSFPYEVERRFPRAIGIRSYPLR